MEEEVVDVLGELDQVLKVGFGVWSGGRRLLQYRVGYARGCRCP